MRATYVSVVDPDNTKRYGLLLGPFVEHDQALGFVDEVRNKASEVNPRGWFYAYGTCKAETQTPGKLNDLFPDAPIAV
jgi:hypothetical protein